MTRDRGTNLALRVLGVNNLGARMRQRRVRRRGGTPPGVGHLATRHAPLPGYAQGWPPSGGAPPAVPLRTDQPASAGGHTAHVWVDGRAAPVAAAHPWGPPPGWAPPAQRPAAPVNATSPAPGWEVLAAPRRDPWWRLARRYVAVAAAGMLLLAGSVSIADTVRSWLTRPAPPPTAAQVADNQFVAVAVPWAVDYLSWDHTDRAARHSALNRAATPNTTVDGWDGTGRQWADSPAVVGVVRGDADRAVVTVRLRVTPYRAVDHANTTVTPPPSSATADPVPNVASGPVTSSPGWVAQQPRWLNLAVALAWRHHRVVVTAPPALVGSAPHAAPGPAVAAPAGVGDNAFAQRTRDTVITLLRAYGSGELDYARADGTTFAGLDRAASVDTLVAWRVRTLNEGDDPAVRVGDVTVTWVLSGGAGKLTCSYRIELRSSGDRWYLASVTAATEAVR